MAALRQRAFVVGYSVSPIRNLKRGVYGIYRGGIYACIHACMRVCVHAFSSFSISRTTAAVLNEVWSEETRRGIVFYFLVVNVDMYIHTWDIHLRPYLA